MSTIAEIGKTGKYKSVMVEMLLLLNLQRKHPDEPVKVHPKYLPDVLALMCPGELTVVGSTADNPILVVATKKPEVK